MKKTVALFMDDGLVSFLADYESVKSSYGWMAVPDGGRGMDPRDKHGGDASVCFYGRPMLV